MIMLAASSPVTLNSPADNDFLITPAQLEASINEHTRLLILNSPSNPSGQAYSRKQLEALGDVLLDHPKDRKSTRLNSSHVAISYAVFCLKKKIDNNKYTRSK